MKNLLTLILTAILLWTPNDSKGENTQRYQEQFFNHVSQLCGRSFVGKTLYPNTPDDPFVGAKLVINFSSCSDNEIRVPFQVDQDTSRTWLIQKTSKGLLLKHDHRHPDGTPDKITMYGGYSQKGNALSQSFNADKHTKSILPAAATNVWTLSFDSDKKQLFYYLERHAKPRYRAVFDLK